MHCGRGMSGLGLVAGHRTQLCSEDRSATTYPLLTGPGKDECRHVTALAVTMVSLTANQGRSMVETSGSSDPQRPSGRTDPKRLKEWIGVATGALAILAFFGVHNWSDIKNWLDHHHTPLQSSTPTLAPSHSIWTPSLSASPAHMVDPGCVEAGNVAGAVTASISGMTSVDPHTASAEFKGFADSFDLAALHANDPQVKTSINAVASDLRVLAVDWAVQDLDADTRMLHQQQADLSGVTAACRTAAAQ